MFQQPEKYFNGQLAPQQGQTMMRPDPCTGHGMGWQPNDYSMSYDIPTSSSYDMTTGYQTNWMATIQNTSSPNLPTSPQQGGSPTYQNAPLSIPQFDQSETAILPPITTQDHQNLNDGLFKTPDSTVFSIKRERSNSTSNPANELANTSSRGTLNKSRRTQPYARAGSNSMQAGSSSGADLLRMEAERKQKNNDRERRRVQIMNQGFDALKEVLTLDTFPVPNPKTKIETWKAPIPIFQILQSHSDYLLRPEDIAVMHSMDPKAPLEESSHTSSSSDV